MSATAPCRTCGTEPPADARFCPSCGSPTTAAVTPAEFKQVTVLFADVVRSMDIASAVGAERLREIMAGLFDRCAAVVRRYGGTVDKFTGDGIMAVFGAPVALEDHAFRACLAALEIQGQIQRVTADSGLQLRVGLNSGQVVAGEIGSGPGSYTAIGAQVGMAQRMESVAPSGGVMVSESTARLVEDIAALGEPESVCIKGAAEPVRAYRLLGVEVAREVHGRFAASLVGRRWEMAAMQALLERAVAGHGGVVGVVAPAGIGKSRLVREITALAAERGVPVYATFCESHASDVPFHAVERLLRAATGVTDLDPVEARAKIRARVPGADAQDLLLFDDLIGIADPAVELPRIDPDARRRRLTALVNADALARPSAEVLVLEDVHWIDEVSEAMLADFVAVVPQTSSLVVITYRPEYRGALSQITGGQTIALAPLNDSESSALITELLGADSSVGRLAGVIADRSAGNPFYAQELVRDLVERGVLDGERGAYRLSGEAEQVTVPATLQATIAARVDRLEPAAKQTLSAASVIGSRFSGGQLEELGIDPAFDELVRAELIDQVRFTPHAEYAFHHPVIRSVAYESQLRSDRTVLHRRLASVIEAQDPGSADANAALIAEHLEAAGDLRDAYAWQMRAGAWSTNRNTSAAQVSWERACRIADGLPDDDADRLAMRIAPRTLICGNAFKSNIPVAGPRFDELQELCAAAGDKMSPAIGMTGLIYEHMLHGRVRAASQVISEQQALIESIGDPTLTVGLAVGHVGVKHEIGEYADVLRLAQTTIDLAADDPAKGNFLIGSPLAVALAARGLARAALGLPGWREDFPHAVAVARSSDPLSYVMCVMWTYGIAVAVGVLLPSPDVWRELNEALRVAEESADDTILCFAALILGIDLLYADSPADERGLELLDQVRDMCVQGRFYSSEIAAIDTWTALAMAACGDRDRALQLARQALNDTFNAGQFAYFTIGARILGEMLLDGGCSDDDLDEVQTVIDRLAAAPLSDGYVVRDLTLLRLRALLARAKGDEVSYRDFAGRYRTMATELRFEGHMALAEAMR